MALNVGSRRCRNLSGVGHTPDHRGHRENGAHDPLYGPAVRRKRFRRSGGFAVLHQCIRPL